MSELTETEKLQQKSARTIKRQRRAYEESCQLQEQVRRGEKTAAQAFRERCESKTSKSPRKVKG